MRKVSGEVGMELLDLVTSSEAARKKGVSRTTINYLVKHRRIRHVRRFGRVLVYLTEVLNYKPQKPGPKPGKSKATKAEKGSTKKRGGKK